LNSTTYLCSIGVSLIITTAIFGLINLNNDSTIINDQNNVRAMLQEPNNSPTNLKILNSQMTKPLFSNWKVKGQAENTGSLEIHNSIININFLDKEKNLLNSNSTKLNNIQPGEIRDFEVEYQGNTSPDSYKIESNT
jgi:hypothetical protein